MSKKNNRNHHVAPNRYQKNGKPQDFKQKDIPFNQLAGSEFFKPFNQVKVEAAIDVLALVSGDEEANEVQLLKEILPAIRESEFIADLQGFDRFAHAGNFKAVLELIGGFVKELSKDLA